MNIVIIEDEQPARERITELLKEIMPDLNVLSNHDSVAGASKWLSLNPAPDLLLLDVQLADGTAFDLLNLIKIECPIIFTTAYRKYALDAFKTTSIDYLLKPIKKRRTGKCPAESERIQAHLQPAGNRVDTKKCFTSSFL